MSLLSRFTDAIRGTGHPSDAYYQLSGRTCAICGATTIPTFAAIDKTVVGAGLASYRPVAVCARCTPPCHKCGRPLHNPQLHALLDKLRANRARHESFTWRFKSCEHGAYLMPYGYRVGEEFTREELEPNHDSIQNPSIPFRSKSSADQPRGLQPSQGRPIHQSIGCDASLDLSHPFEYSTEEDIAELLTLRSVVLNTPPLHGSIINELLANPIADLEAQVSARSIRSNPSLEQVRRSIRNSPSWACVDPVLLETIMSVMGADSSSLCESVELAELYGLPQRVFRHLHSTEYYRRNALTVVAFSWYVIALRLLARINSSPNPWTQVKQGESCLRLASQADHYLISVPIALIYVWRFQARCAGTMGQSLQKEHARLISLTEQSLTLLQLDAMDPKTRVNLNTIQILIAQNASRYLDIIRQARMDVAES